MIVVSLFDGMACGLEALKRAGVKVTEYHAFENDKYAIQIAKKNHPEIIHHGEINFMTDFSHFKGADLLIGGSPCQGFSMAGKGLNFKDKRSQLFFEYLRAKKEIKPKRFLLENVKMKKEIQDEISRLMGCQPIFINSALVSAQNRQRLYWCNWKVRQPDNRNIFLKDIIENGVVDRDKSYCIDANYYKGGSLKNYLEKKRRQFDNLAQSEKRLMVTCIAERGRRLNENGIRDDKNGIINRRYEAATDGKTFCLSTVQKDNYIAENEIIRKLTPIECERLQTLPDNYTEGVSNSQRYKMLGNGWTCEVITHVFKEGNLC